MNYRCYIRIYRGGGREIMITVSLWSLQDLALYFSHTGQFWQQEQRLYCCVGWFWTCCDGQDVLLSFWQTWYTIVPFYPPVARGSVMSDCKNILLLPVCQGLWWHKLSVLSLCHRVTSPRPRHDSNNDRIIIIIMVMSCHVMVREGQRHRTGMPYLDSQVSYRPQTNTKWSGQYFQVYFAIKQSL